MTVLKKYRQEQAIARRGMRRAVILSAMLVVVIAMMVRLGGSRRRPAPAGETTPRTVVPGRTGGEATPAPPLPAWQPLPPAEERALLAKITDQAPLGLREHREAYYYLLHKVARMSDEEMAANLDAAIGYEDYRGQPDIIRGSIVEISGRLLRLEETPLDPEKAGLIAVYEGQILGADNHIYSFRLTDRPAPPLVPGKNETRGARRVRLRGVFMQVVAYQNRENPPQHVAAPLIIGRRLSAMPGPRLKPRPAPWQWLVVLAALAVAIGIWLFAFAGRRALVSKGGH